MLSNITGDSEIQMQNAIEMIRAAIQTVPYGVSQARHYNKTRETKTALRQPDDAVDGTSAPRLARATKLTLFRRVVCMFVFCDPVQIRYVLKFPWPIIFI